MQVENLGMRVSEYIPEGLLLPFSYHLYLPNGNELVLTIRTLFCKVLQRQLKFSKLWDETQGTDLLSS